MGSSVFAQLDANQQFVAANVMELMSDNLQQTNARLGDVYFIGEEQLNGALSSPRFDEQGAAGTLYALASAQSCRFGHRAIPATSLGLPREFARMLDGMLDPDPDVRRRAGDHFTREMPRLARLVMLDLPEPPETPLVPVWSRAAGREIDTVVYSSRKSFLREEGGRETLSDVNDVQLDRYYKNFMQGMGETEKAFLAAVSRLGNYPVVGGWRFAGRPKVSISTPRSTCTILPSSRPSSPPSTTWSAWPGPFTAEASSRAVCSMPAILSIWSARGRIVPS